MRFCESCVGRIGSGRLNRITEKAFTIASDSAIPPCVIAPDDTSRSVRSRTINHEHLIEVHIEGAVPVTGYLALDSFVGGAAHGGLRIANDVTADRLRQAARTMTLKYGWAGLPVGGAKAGLLVSPDATELDRALMLRAFGEAISPYLRNGVYVPGEDMGSSHG